MLANGKGSVGTHTEYGELPKDPRTCTVAMGTDGGVTDTVAVAVGVCGGTGALVTTAVGETVGSAVARWTIANVAVPVATARPGLAVTIWASAPDCPVSTEAVAVGVTSTVAAVAVAIGSTTAKASVGVATTCPATNGVVDVPIARPVITTTARNRTRNQTRHHRAMYKCPFSDDKFGCTTSRDDKRSPRGVTAAMDGTLCSSSYTVSV